MPTPLRNIRVDDELWEAAKEAAASRGQTLSEVIRAALGQYVRATPLEATQG